MELTLVRLPEATLSPAQVAWVRAAAEALVLTTVAFCLIRAVPVLWEGRRYFFAASPTSAKTIAGGAQ